MRFENLRGALASSLRRLQYARPVDVIGEDWDTLIILDACRYDSLRRLNPFDANIESRISPASTSHRYLKSQFGGRELHDTVYVTANPFVGQLDDDVFHATISVLDDWDEELQTVRPESVVERVEAIFPKYQDKRLIVHFMQPHQPYLGPTGDAIRERISERGARRGWDPSLRTDDNHESFLHGITELQAAQSPDIEVTPEDIHDAYHESLAIVLDSVHELVGIVDDKTVITADHGEMLGERRFGRLQFGHPAFSVARELLLIPWVVLDGERREITADRPQRYDVASEIDEKLTALGYTPGEI